MASIIQTTANPHYSMRVKLGGDDFNITLKWNTRTSSWYCKVADTYNVDIIAYERLASHQPVVLYNKDKFASGNLYVLPTTVSNEVLGFDNLGLEKNFSLVYLTKEEIEELSGGLL